MFQLYFGLVANINHGPQWNRGQDGQPFWQLNQESDCDQPKEALYNSVKCGRHALMLLNLALFK